MKKDTYQKVRELIAQNNGILSTKQAREKGIQSWYLTKMIRTDELERVSTGIYYDSSFESYDEQYIFQLANQRPGVSPLG
ncbi:MAG: type IV toxin-antitoxin system AbiEi family antitoxin domain-containing protein [Coriobacteriia bacterium]|nr:type IV toxin-antitoxin system AbiEi family antitoxin domain-containing protein [Coriobacteriia bacterium]